MKTTSRLHLCFVTLLTFVFSGPISVLAQTTPPTKTEYRCEVSMDGDSIYVLRSFDRTPTRFHFRLEQALKRTLAKPVSYIRLPKPDSLIRRFVTLEFSATPDSYDYKIIRFRQDKETELFCADVESGVSEWWYGAPRRQVKLYDYRYRLYLPATGNELLFFEEIGFSKPYAFADSVQTIMARWARRKGFSISKIEREMPEDRIIVSIDVPILAPSETQVLAIPSLRETVQIISDNAEDWQRIMR